MLSTTEAFIRSVEAAPEPMCVLSTDQQLYNMERFCTQSPSSVLPTFNLGDFYVTPTTFHNLLVKNRQGCHPIISGPILIYRTKEFEPFHYFASTLVRLNPNIMNLKSFGTDGESQLIKAFQVVFPHAVHLRCSNHLRQNVKDKLHALAIPQNLWKEFLSDIFGQQVGTQYEKGLVDSESPEVFKNALARLESRWNNLESSVSERDPQFHSWFAQYKMDLIANSVLPPVREKAGYVSGKIGEKFTTNVSESLNHVIKQEVEWKESKLPILVEHLKAITNQHEAEMEKPVIGRGEWKFIELYKHFEVDNRIWFPKMSLECRQKHMKKIKSWMLVRPVVQWRKVIVRLP